MRALGKKDLALLCLCGTLVFAGLTGCGGTPENTVTPIDPATVPSAEEQKQQAQHYSTPSAQDRMGN